MNDHIHAEFGTIGAQLHGIDKKLDENREDQKTQTATLAKIFDRLEGPGGLREQVVILKTKFTSIPSIKTLIIYASIGGGLTSGALMAAKFLIKG